jgi:hypothetical protein
MATIDIGKIKPVFKGTYDNSTAYVLDDIVYYNGSSYVAKTSTTGNLPTDATKWNVLASGSGGIWDSTLSIGSAGQVVKVNSGGNALEFGTDQGGKIGQVVNMVKTDTTSVNSTSYTDISGCQISITPTATNSKILLMANFTGQSHEQYYYHRYVRDISGGSSNVSPTGWVGTASGSRVQSALGNNYQHVGNGDASATGEISFWNVDDSHNTTSAITYKLQARSSGGSYTFYYGRSHSDTNTVNTSRSPAIVMVAWEILA